MAFVVIIGFFFIIALGGAVFTTVSGIKAGPFLAAGGFILLAGLTTLFSSYHQTEAGEVGIVKSFGGSLKQVVYHSTKDEKAGTNGGIFWTLPWESFDTENVQLQKVTTKDALSTFSAESQDVFIHVTINYQLDRDQVLNIRRQIGDDVYGKVIFPQVNTAVKEETVAYSTVDIAPNREKIRQAVKARVQKFISDNHYAITISDILFDNIDYSPQFKAAIENKQASTQEALNQEAKVATSLAQAKQVAAVAQGEADKVTIASIGAATARINAANADAAAILATAKAQAEANNLINASLTPNVLQLQAINKLNPGVSTVIIPSGSGLLIDPTTLIGKK